MTAPRRGRRHRRAFLFGLLITIMAGLIGAPATSGDELADALAKQKTIEARIASQKIEVAKLNALQKDLRVQISSTTRELDGINADLAAVRRNVNSMVAKVDLVRTTYQGLVDQLVSLDAQLVDLSIQEAAKARELADRKALLADHLRAAYDTDRTSLLETFLSADSFTDVLSQVSYILDVGEQDRLLAQQIQHDQVTLAAIHRTVETTRTSTEELRVETAQQKKDLDARLAELRRAQAQLKKLEKATQVALDKQKTAFAKVAKNKKALEEAMAKAKAAQKALEKQIDKLVAEQYQHGNIPSEYNGTLIWPMAGRVTQDYGCTGFPWEPPVGNCAHFHGGIDVVAPAGTPVKSAGDGQVVYIGWNWADGYDPAWIVIIAHAQGMETWYAHLQAKRPVEQGQFVRSGQVIGYEGNTGHSTGAHLHWAVRRNGEFVNPRLYL